MCTISLTVTLKDSCFIGFDLYWVIRSAEPDLASNEWLAKEFLVSEKASVERPLLI